MDKRLFQTMGLTAVATLALSSFSAQGRADDKKAAPTAPAAAAPAAPGAPSSGPPPAPKPGPEMDQLKFFVGKWKCDGKQFANPMFGPEHTFKASAEAKPDGDGFYQSWTYEEKKSKEHMGFKVHGMWGWNAGTKTYVRMAADNRGSWDTATSPGLDGDKIVWSGDISGPMGKMPFRHTFTKKSEKEWIHALEMKGPDGKWTPTEEVTCKK